MVRNSKRTEASRRKLIAAARRLMGKRGFSGTTTPDIARAAGVSRGALYHHFDDKNALFLAVVEAEFRRVREAIEAGEAPDDGVLDILIEGGTRFMKAMADPVTTQILLVDAPAVLGPDVVRDIDERTTTAALREGIETAQREGVLPASIPTSALTSLMTGAYDRAVLDAAAAPERKASIDQALRAIWHGLAKHGDG